MKNMDNNSTFDDEIKFRKEKNAKVERYGDNQEILIETKQLRKEAIQRRKKERRQKYQIEFEKKEHLGLKLRIKKWWFGMFKENSRIFWPARSILGKNFAIVILLLVFFVLIFFGLEQLFLTLNIIN